MAYSSPNKMVQKHGKGLMMKGSVNYMHEGESHEEKLVSKETTRTRETTPEGITGTRLTTTSKFETPGGEVKRTVEGDKAYAALSKEQRKTQDEKFLAKKRSESQTRFTPDAIKVPIKGVDIKTGLKDVKFDVPSAKEVSENIINRRIHDVFYSDGKPDYGARKQLYTQLMDKNIKDFKSGIITRDQALREAKAYRNLPNIETPEEVKDRERKQDIKQFKRKLKKRVENVFTSKGQYRGGGGDGVECTTC